jgi:hypothetical protein
LQIAAAYLGHGWSVVPIRPGEKQPLVRWDEFQRRLPSRDELRAWFGRWPEAGLGIVTGRVSGIAVLDVDPRHGGSGSLAALEGAHGAPPATIEAVTGGGGRHLYFALPAAPLSNRVGIAPGLDLRADGGIVVAPPSLHPSGRRYAWRRGHGPADLAPAAMPEWLVELARADASRRGHAMAYWRELARLGVAEGARNSTLVSLAGHLLWHGVDPEVALELLLCWNRERCRPPLEDQEVARAVASITRLHLARESEADDGGQRT